MISAPYIQVYEIQRIVDCPICGVTFGLPAAMFLTARAQGGTVYCPKGDPWQPRAEGEPAGQVDILRAELVAKVADLELRARMAEARAELLTPAASPAQKLNNKEILRRCRILAGRAGAFEDGPKTHVACPSCGRGIRRVGLAAHLRRQHAADVARKPAEHFDAAADLVLRRIGGSL